MSQRMANTQFWNTLSTSQLLYQPHLVVPTNRIIKLIITLIFKMRDQGSDNLKALPRFTHLVGGEFKYDPRIGIHIPRRETQRRLE